jgi:hypothetical protein
MALELGPGIDPISAVHVGVLALDPWSCRLSGSNFPVGSWQSMGFASISLGLTVSFEASGSVLVLSCMVGCSGLDISWGCFHHGSPGGSRS